MNRPELAPNPPPTERSSSDLNRSPMKPHPRVDALDPLPMDCEWPSLRSFSGRVDIHSLAASFVRESQLRGSYFEFGVASGRSAIRANRRENPLSVTPFLLFDSFRGLPELKGRDADSKQFQAGNDAFSVEQVIANLQQHGAYYPEIVHLIPGWFEHTLPAFPAAQLGVAKAAIVHIDTDLYSSCVTVLDFIEPFLQVGTVMIFDDWNAFCASQHKGERAATAGWLEQNPQWQLNEYAAYSWHGRAFIVDAGPDTSAERGG